jgi:hypothetical protein
LLSDNQQPGLLEFYKMKKSVLLVLCLLPACLQAQGQTANDDFYVNSMGSALTVSAPGVLANDTGSGTLTAARVAGPLHGSLTLNGNGSFVYTPTNSFSGVDSFTYRASNGSQTSGVANVNLMILAPGEMFYDNCARPAGDSSPFPWTQVTINNQSVQGTWNITNNLLAGSSPFYSYGYAYYDNPNWTDYSVQAQVQFSSLDAASAGICGRLNPTNGAHYAAWIYPEESNEQNITPGHGTAVLQLIKYKTWTNYTLIGSTVTLPGIGTAWHTLKMAFQGNTISAYFDGALITSATDTGNIDKKAAYTHGGIAVNMYTKAPIPYTFSVDNIIVSTNVAVANADFYPATNNTLLSAPAPGILANDSGNGTLTALLVSGPSGGTLTLTNNGGFTYLPTNPFVGTDTFSYRVTDGQTTSAVTTVSLSVNNLSFAADDLFTTTVNTALNVAQPGILANDGGGIGPLTVTLISGPANGTLSLSTNGAFSYTPATNFTGMDGFTYQTTDGSTTSRVATAAISVTYPGQFVYDNFSRPGNPNNIFPWIDWYGNWSITNGVMSGTSDLSSYGYAYCENTGWTDYVVRAQIRFPESNDWGGAIGGRLDPVSGSHYDVWVYPEGSPSGPPGVATLQMDKYESWVDFTSENLITLPAVGTNWHNLALAFQGNNVFASFDGVMVTNLSDDGSFDGMPAYTNGGVCLALWEQPPTTWSFQVSNVVIAPLVMSRTFTVMENSTLSVTNPGVLANATDVYGTNPTVALAAGPAAGSMNLSANGSFTYTPSTNFAGTDRFIYQASDGANFLGTAAVTINVLPLPAPPVITAITLTNGTVTLTWTSVPGTSYRVQYENSLSDSGWIDLSPDVTATGLTASRTNFVGATPQQFYRVRLLTP